MNKMNPVAFEVLLLARDLTFRKYNDKMKKTDQYSKPSIDYPTEIEIIMTAESFMKFLNQYCEEYVDDYMDDYEPMAPTKSSKKQSVDPNTTSKMITTDSNNQIL